MNDSNAIDRSSVYGRRFVIVLRPTSIIAALATYKYVYNYYMLLIPGMRSVFVGLYNIVTLFFLLLYIPLFISVLSRIRYKEYKYLIPTIVIPACVILNIIYVMLTEGGLSIISRSYLLQAASGTNDSTGFYFSQLNTWLGNMAITLYLALRVKDKKEIADCVISSLAVIIIPLVLLIVIHPDYLGLRKDVFDGVSFGGGIWNIGTIGFGSLTWIAIALSHDFSKGKRNFAIFSIIVLIFVGVSGLSRTMILMIAFSFGLYMLISRKDTKFYLKILVVLVMVGIYFTLESDIVAALFQRFGDNTSGTNNIRFLLWKSYLSNYKEFWLLGAPLGSVYRYYHGVNLAGRYFLPHSTPMNFFIRYGIFALVAYLCLLKNSFFSIRKSPENEYYRNCIISGGIAYISLAFINQTGFAEPVFYVMFGLLMAFTRILNNDHYTE